MIVTVKEYNYLSDFHRCVDENKNQINLDLIAYGHFHDETKDLSGQDYLDFMRGLAGRKFSIMRTDPWVSFADGITEIKEES